jgi:hypothetical protein
VSTVTYELLSLRPDGTVIARVPYANLEDARSAFSCAHEVCLKEGGRYSLVRVEELVSCEGAKR